MRVSVQISKSAAVLIAFLAAIFWFFSRQPLSHTDLWGHLSYGRWIAEKGELPAADPFMPLSHAIAVIDTAWLAQLVAFGVETAGGTAGLQFLYAAAVAASGGLLAGGLYRKTGRLAPALVASGAFLALEWFQLRIIRPQIAGVVAFALVQVLLSTGGGRRIVWAIPALFVVWANLHGSFVTGLGLLALCTIGQAIDKARRKNEQPAGQDRCALRLLAVTVLSGLAVLINPYGPHLFGAVLTFARNPNLRDLVEWTPLQFGTWQGQIFAATGIVLLAAAAFSRRKCSAFDGLPLVVFGAATLYSARMIVWWGPLAAWSLAEQFDAAFGQWRGRCCDHADLKPAGALALPATEPRREPAGPIPRTKAPGRFAPWSTLAAAAVCLAIADCPLAKRLVGGDAGEGAASLSSATPVAAVAWLRGTPSGGLVFCPSEWGDYLVWAGPQDASVIVTSHVHLILPEVWRDYRAISRGDPGALSQLDAYRVTAALVDRRKQSRLASRLSADSRWRREYADDQAFVFVRRAQ
jgi:hypothetical protein